MVPFPVVKEMSYSRAVARAVLTKINSLSTVSGHEHGYEDRKDVLYNCVCKKFTYTNLPKAVVNCLRMVYTPEFDSVLTKKVPQPALSAACETFMLLSVARYALYFFVWEQIFLIFFIGTICFDVQKPNASCSASVSSVLV